MIQESQRRIPTENLRKGAWQTYFSVWDQWLMHMVFDDRTCDSCFSHQDEYAGSELRSAFPYLEIQDEDLIYAHVHPHCRCYLVRVPRPEDPRYLEGGYLNV